jgi:tetratricopeptide (TPR) repeat protein
MADYKTLILNDRLLWVALAVGCLAEPISTDFTLGIQRLFDRLCRVAPNERAFMPAKYRPIFLTILACMFALTRPGSTFGQQTAEEFLERGKTDTIRNDWDDAVTDYSKVIELDPKNTFAYTSRGFANIHQRDFDGAIADYTKAIKLKPNDATSYFYRGLARTHRGGKGDLDSAIADYTKAIKLKPNDADIYYARGIAKGKKSDWNGAIADYSKTIAINPKYPAYHNRGDAKKAKGDQAGADADYAQAKRLQGG